MPKVSIFSVTLDIVNPHIVDYLLNVAPERDAILQEMEQHALEQKFPIVGPLVGRFLFLMAKAIQANRILELGSGFGYSAYWLAKAIGKDGQIICTEDNPDNVRRAGDYLTRAKLSQKITLLTGDALQLLDKLDGPFDLIFNDLDKHQYPKAFRKVLPKLRKGGLLISDNVLWSGKILDKKPDTDTAGILTYNRLIHSSRDLFSSVLPIRDGVSVSIRL